MSSHPQTRPEPSLRREPAREVPPWTERTPRRVPSRRGAPVMRLRAVTLNVLHGAPVPGFRRGRDSLERRLEWIARVLGEERPDVVLLQEASVSRRHGNTAKILAETLDMQFVYARANPRRPWRLGQRVLRQFDFEEGPAVLSRLPMVEHRTHRLSSRFSLFDQRLALEIVLDGPFGRFSVFSVHLTARSAAARRRQIAALVRAVEGTPRVHPAIVGGDFNAEERSYEIHLLTEIAGWLDSFRHLNPHAAGNTWPQALAAATATASSRIDFLFSVPSGAEHWTPRYSRVILNHSFPGSRDEVLWASDHYGVLTDFEAPSTRRNCAE